jgi:hypothetical protein
MKILDPNSNPSVVQPVASRYTDWASAAYLSTTEAIKKKHFVNIHKRNVKSVVSPIREEQQRLFTPMLLVSSAQCEEVTKTADYRSIWKHNMVMRSNIVFMECHTCKLHIVQAAVKM